MSDSSKTLVYAGLVGIGAVVLGYNSLFTVQNHHAALVMDRLRGCVRSYKKGIHLKIPFLQYVVQYPIDISPIMATVATETKDKEPLNIQIRLLLQPNENRMIDFYNLNGKELLEGKNFEKIKEVVKSVIVLYDALEVVTKRSEWSPVVSDLIEEQTSKQGVSVENCAVWRLQFTKECEERLNAEMAKLFNAEKNAQQ